MNRNFGKLNDGKVSYAPDTLHVGRSVKLNPASEDYLAAGWKSIIDERIPYMEGYTIVDDGWEDGDVFLTHKYRYEPIKHTEYDFDAAMEEHIRRTGEERGYTTHNPIEYISSTVPRWAQDAADFVKFRDEVMVYGLTILNEWKATGVEPNYDEFVANLPKIKWTEE